MELDEYTVENGPELEALFSAGRPFVIRGLVNNWPLKKAGESSFSSLSKPSFAHKYAFFSIFQILQHLHTFAPFQFHKF